MYFSLMLNFKLIFASKFYLHYVVEPNEVHKAR